MSISLRSPLLTHGASARCCSASNKRAAQHRADLSAVAPHLVNCGLMTTPVSSERSNDVSPEPISNQPFALRILPRHGYAP